MRLDLYETRHVGRARGHKETRGARARKIL